MASPHVSIHSHYMSLLAEAVAPRSNILSDGGNQREIIQKKKRILQGHAELKSFDALMKGYTWSLALKRSCLSRLLTLCAKCVS